MSTDVRRRILDVTLDLIGERGIGGVTNRVVATTAGVSPGTLTYHFPSQDNLLAEALSLFVDDEITRLSAIAAQLDSAPDQNYDDLLNAACEAIEDHAARHKQIAQLELYLHATRNPDLLQAATRCYEAYDHLCASVLRALGVPEPERLAPLLGAFVDGFELRRLAIGAPAVGLAEAVSVFIAGLTPGSD